jgi:hypothetical protein
MLTSIQSFFTFLGGRSAFTSCVIPLSFAVHASSPLCSLSVPLLRSCLTFVYIVIYSLRRSHTLFSSDHHQNITILQTVTHLAKLSYLTSATHLATIERLPAIQHLLAHTSTAERSLKCLQSKSRATMPPPKTKRGSSLLFVVASPPLLRLLLLPCHLAFNLSYFPFVSPPDWLPLHLASSRFVSNWN